jgi:hypothetical protein
MMIGLTINNKYEYLDIVEHLEHLEHLDKVGKVFKKFNLYIPLQ